MGVKALYQNIKLTRPGLDEVRDNFNGVVVKIRDRSERALNITFGSIWQYTKVDESYSDFLMQPITTSLKPGVMPHWLYEVSKSANLKFFMNNNPHCPSDMKEWLVVLVDDAISLIGRGEPTISERDDDIRSFTLS
jgi:hypothetical protein